MSEFEDQSQLTPEQRAAKRRAKQTLNNLLLSLAACSALVLGLVLIVPRDNSNRIQPVDYVAVAQTAAQSSQKPLIVPPLLNSDWWSNSARWSAKPADGVAVWYVGFVGPKNQYVALTQAFDSNPTWLTLFLKESIVNGEKTIEGRKFTVYQSTVKNSPAKSKDYALVTEVNSDQIIVYGTATQAELEQFAALVAKQISTQYAN